MGSVHPCEDHHSGGCGQPWGRGSGRGYRSWLFSRRRGRRVPGLCGHLPGAQVLGVVAGFQQVRGRTVSEDVLQARVSGAQAHMPETHGLAHSIEQRRRLRSLRCLRRRSGFIPVTPRVDENWDYTENRWLTDYAAHGRISARRKIDRKCGRLHGQVAIRLASPDR